MLDVIGAGATATCTTDWNQIWKESPEAAELEQEIERIPREGRSRPVTNTESHPELVSSWTKQLGLLTQRGFLCHWRNPTYIYSKLIFFVFGGLAIGLTFFRATNSLQGCQAKLFVGVFCASFKCEGSANAPRTVCPHGEFALRTNSVSITGQIYRKPNRLRVARASFEDVHLVGVSSLPVSNRNPVAHFWHLLTVFLLVLDFRV